MNQRSKFFFSDIELKYQHSSYDLKYKKDKNGVEQCFTKRGK